MIRQFVLYIPFIIAMSGAQAQDSVNLKKDLDTLLGVFKKLPSYKAQIHGQRLEQFNTVYRALYTSGMDPRANRQAFHEISKLFFSLKDNHLAFYELPPVALRIDQLSDSAAVKQYRNMPYARSYPRLNIDADSLERILTNQTADSLEGIYYYDQYLKVGLFRSEVRNEYTGIVLASKLPHWERGQVAIWLYEHAPHAFHAIYGHPLFKNLTLYNNEKFINRSLANAYFHSSVSHSVYRKNPGDSDYVTIPRTIPTFSFKSLSPDVQYMRIGSFSNSQRSVKLSASFLENLKDSLTAPHLILDLRDNTGGAAAVSDKFLKFINRYAARGKVYVLVNNGTMSRGEIFFLQLKGRKNIQTFGQTTNGTLAYGSNSGKTVRLPSGKFQIYITDMKDKRNHVAYENTGVAPEVWFKNDGDWIDKVLALINRQ